MLDESLTPARQLLSLRVSLNKEDDTYGFLEDQVSLTPLGRYSVITNIFSILNVLIFDLFDVYLIWFIRSWIFIIIKINIKIIFISADKRILLKFAFSNRLSLFLFEFEWFQRLLIICLFALFLLASFEEPSNYISVQKY